MKIDSLLLKFPQVFRTLQPSQMVGSMERRGAADTRVFLPLFVLHFHSKFLPVLHLLFCNKEITNPFCMMHHARGCARRAADRARAHARGAVRPPRAARGPRATDSELRRTFVLLLGLGHCVVTVRTALGCGLYVYRFTASLAPPRGRFHLTTRSTVLRLTYCTASRCPTPALCAEANRTTYPLALRDAPPLRLQSMVGHGHH